MDYLEILKRAWELTWRYRALWVFGILLALTTGGGGGGTGYSFNGGNLAAPGGQFALPQVGPEVVRVLIAIGIAFACLMLVLIVLAILTRYVAETALIRMVNEHEATRERLSVRQGLRLGWSRAAWRMFLIDLLIGLPTVLAFILLFALALAPLLLWTTQNRAAGLIGTLVAIALFSLVILLAIVVGVGVSLLTKFFRRACALEGVGVIASVRHGYGLVKRYLKDVAVMWLIMLGLGLGLGLAMFVVGLVLFGLGAVLGGLPALLVGILTGQIWEGAVPWLLAAAVGLPIFVIVTVLPLLFVSGLVQVFKSSVWTLAYRELSAQEGAVAGQSMG